MSRVKVSVDDLIGFSDIINAVFQKVEIQRCIVNHVGYLYKLEFNILNPVVARHALSTGIPSVPYC